MKIFIAAGHGGNDPGAVANNTTERDLVQKIVDESVKLLKPILAGKAEIIQVPNEQNVNGTAEWINSQGAGQPTDFCIEVHMNSNAGTPGSGTETYYGNKEMATIIQKKLVEVLGLPDRGVKDGQDLKFNRVTKPASCLAELGFINNPKDLEVVKAKGMSALAKAICELVGVKIETVQLPIITEKGLLQEIKIALEQEIKNLEQIHDKIN